MSNTIIINTISFSDQLRMNKVRNERSQSSIGEKNELANLPVNPLHLVVSGPIMMNTSEMDKFAPKEASSLRRKLGSFDAAKMNPSVLYPDGDQTIYNLMERLDTPPELDFLEELNKQGRFFLFRRCKTIVPYRGFIILYSVFNRAITLIFSWFTYLWIILFVWFEKLRFLPELIKSFNSKTLTSAHCCQCRAEF